MAIERQTSNDPLVPEPVAQDIIQGVPAMSAVMSMARRVAMSSKTNRQPVLSTLPEAYFVNGDTGLKQTDRMDWKNVDLVAEEIAVIIPIPEAYLDDAQTPIWPEVRPRIVEAFGAKVDAACLFGTDKPGTWGTSVYQGAVAAGNAVVEGTGADLAADIAAVGQLMAEDGCPVNGFVSAPGFDWRLTQMRSSDGAPIYQRSLEADRHSTLYGYAMPEVKNGAWDASEALVLGGDWDKAVFGLRQDITFKVFTEGVISDNAGNVILNLMQQDSVALRAVMRCGWAVANPATRLDQDVKPAEGSGDAPTDSGTRFPFGVLQAATAAS